MEVRAEIVVNGLVQGVGDRYFVVREAQKLALKGFTKNLYAGEVLTIVEGERAIVEEMIQKLKVGPIHANQRFGKGIKMDPPYLMWKEFDKDLANDFSLFITGKLYSRTVLTLPERQMAA